MPVTISDNKKKATNYSGKHKERATASGTRSVKAIELTKIYWSKKEVEVDKPVDASIETIGIKNGAKVAVTFFEEAGNGDVRNYGTLETEIKGDKAKTTWVYKQAQVKKSCIKQYNPLVYFQVSVEGLQKVVNSPKIRLYHTLKIKLLDEYEKPVKNERVYTVLSNGKISQNEKTNGSGELIVNKVPPCGHYIVFPDQPNAERADDHVADPFKKSPQKLLAIPKGDEADLFRLVTLYCYCLHKSGDDRRLVSNTSLFEVVPDTKGDNSYKDTVTILSPDQLSLSSGGAPLEEGPREAGLYAYRLPCKQDFKEAVPKIWKADFWKGLVKPKEYSVTGLPKSLMVKCYRPDIYKFQMQFPSLLKTSVGVEYKANLATVSSNMAKGKTTELKASEPKIEAEAWSGNFPRPLTEKTPVALSRNDTKLELKFLDAAGTVIDLVKKLNGVMNKVTDSLPKAGWYYKVENQFFQGTFVLEWGWKEYKDHRAYYYIGANIDLKLIEVKFEIGVGVDVSFAELQVYGAITGSVTLSFKGSRISPDGKVELALPFGAEIIAGLGARCNAASFIKLEGVAETGLKINDGAFKWTKDDGFSIGCALQWTGLSVKVTATVKGKKNGEEQDAAEKGGGEKVWELVAPVDLGKWEWPKPDYEYKPEIMDPEKFHEMLVKVLTKGQNVRVEVNGNYLDYDVVAKKIEGVIHRKRGLKFDPKNAEAMALEIRNELTILMRSYGMFSYDHMKESTFNNFLAGKLPVLLNGYVDELQSVVDAHS